MEVEWTQKWSILSKDLIILGTAAAFFGLIRKQKALFWILFIGGMLVAAVNYLKPIELPIKKAAAAEHGELLIEIDVPEKLELVQLQYGITIRPAFEVNHPTLLSDWYIIDIPDAAEIDVQDMKKVLAHYGVVEENEQVQVAPMITRKLPNINQKFGINDPGLQHLWGFEAMQVNKLYDYLKKTKIKPKKKAKIAILDTGVDAKHEDLKANYTSIQKKYDIDAKGHGTHCAGIAAAVSNNAKGTASFAPNSEFVEITSVKVLNNFGMGTQQGIIKGMIEAANKGADVISMSLGAYSNDSRQKAYSEAVQYCREKGAIVVAAAGNSNDNAKKFSPANAKGIITVSALQQNLQKATFSNTVQDVEMGIAAPGKDIYSSIPGSKYQTFSGTSMAAPYVAGLLGIMKSLQPDLTTEAAYEILEKTGKFVPNHSVTGKLIMPFEVVRTFE